MKDAEKWQRQKTLAESGGVCEICFKPLSDGQAQGAHRIANTEPNRNKWGSWVIDHPLNIAMVCSLNCNQVCNIGNNPEKCLRLVKRIVEYDLRRF